MPVYSAHRPNLPQEGCRRGQDQQGRATASRSLTDLGARSLKDRARTRIGTGCKHVSIGLLNFFFGEFGWHGSRTSRAVELKNAIDTGATAEGLRGEATAWVVRASLKRLNNGSRFHGDESGGGEELHLDELRVVL